MKKFKDFLYQMDEFVLFIMGVLIIVIIGICGAMYHMPKHDAEKERNRIEFVQECVASNLTENFCNVLFREIRK